MKHVTNNEINEENFNVSKRSPVKTLFLAFSGIFVIFVFLIMFLFFLGGLLINLVPKSLENKVGIYIKNNYVIENISKDKTEKARLTLKELDTEKLYEVYVVKNSLVNALALPGNIILIYEGLYDISNKDEINFVIAHELAHFKNRDHLKSFMRIVFVGAVMNLINQDATSFLVTKTINLVSLFFSRDAEYKADKVAIQLLKEKNMNVGGALSFMEKIFQMEEKNVLVYFSTHPNTRDRIEKIKEIM